jgi:EmrB/QacA subfamily drug resistance transporter
MRSKTTEDRRRWIALGVVCLGQLMMVLDATIVNVALPSIQRDLHFTQANLAWIVDAYMIAFGSFLLLAGRLGDLIGRKRVFLAGLMLFTTASIVCGIAGDQTVLIAARFVQGLGGAVASSVILALIVTEFPEPGERAIAMSVYTFIISSGGSIGLFAGGVLTQSINWHWIFFINVPIGIATLLLGRRLIDETEGIGIDKGIDVLGSVLMTVATMIVVYAIVTASDHGWGSAHTLGFAAAGLALLGAFLVLESRVANPIFPLRILRLRGLIVTSVVRGFLVTGMFSTFFLGALYLQRVRHYGAFETGLAFLPMTLVLGTLSLGITARIMARVGSLRLLVFGLVSIVCGLLILSQSGAHASYWPSLAISFALLGVGAGTAFLPLMTIAMADVPSRDAGLASGIVNASLQISAAIGIAALGTIAAARTKTLAHGETATAHALTAGYDLSWLIGAGSVAAGVIVALAFLRTPREPQVDSASTRLDERVAVEAAAA